jgi:hypothetical protein
MLQNTTASLSSVSVRVCMNYKELRRWIHLYLRVYMDTYDVCITNSLNLYRGRNKLNQTNQSNSVDQTDSQFQYALDQILRWIDGIHAWS